jgi:hypothetical protein
MISNHFTVPIESRKEKTDKLFRFIRIAYGVIFGLAFALFTWGRDGLILSSNAADAPWAKLLLGLPIALAIGLLAGWLTAVSSTIIVSIVVWTVAAALLTLIAGHMPFEGGNLAAWLADRRFWGEAIIPFDHAAGVRTTVLFVVNTMVGAAVGFVEERAVEWTWDRTTADDRMNWRSWGVLLLTCIFMALIPTISIDGYINQPLRDPLQVVNELVTLTVAGTAQELVEARGTGYRTIEPFRDLLSRQYVSHFVAFDSNTENWYSAYVDVAFDDGFVLRCATSGRNVLYCDDFGEKFTGWMGDLVHAGLYDERLWLDERMRRLTVDDAVVNWLAARREQLGENFQVSRDGQQGGWILMSARFDNGFEILCRFQGATPIRVDQCVEATSLP